MTPTSARAMHPAHGTHSLVQMLRGTPGKALIGPALATKGINYGLSYLKLDMQESSRAGRKFFGEISRL